MVEHAETTSLLATPQIFRLIWFYVEVILEIILPGFFGFACMKLILCDVFIGWSRFLAFRRFGSAIYALSSLKIVKPSN